MQPAPVSHIVWIYKQGLKGLRAGYIERVSVMQGLTILDLSGVLAMQSYLSLLQELLISS